MNINIRDVPKHLLTTAAARADIFNEDFPDRQGVRNGAIYGLNPISSMYVYRTKTGIIVARGLAGKP